MVDFRIPQAAGTAQGATYDSKNNELTLHSAIDIQTEGQRSTRIQAIHGTITKTPRVLTMESAELSDEQRTVLADHATLDLAADNSIQQVHAAGNVRLNESGGMQLQAPLGELKLGAKNTVESALFSGGVDFESPKQAASGHSGEMRMNFAQEQAKQRNEGGPTAQLKTIYASQGATLRQAAREGSKNPQSLVMSSDAMTFELSSGRLFRSAQTEGPGQLTISVGRRQERRRADGDRRAAFHRRIWRREPFAHGCTARARYG